MDAGRGTAARADTRPGLNRKECRRLSEYVRVSRGESSYRLPAGLRTNSVHELGVVHAAQSAQGRAVLDLRDNHVGPRERLPAWDQMPPRTQLIAARAGMRLQ